ncbi:hypothetical protein SLEP1_g38308 [Rubroshorea leprosula]|uniref:Protein kinase domain-containing protein n=1 Tax=Rubroshorea leprosula TaxID=152421 RepID=A0AAV5KXW3_9ROSI|nr:hypothetical protein SLEP1_g38308 [Rubroshorea leprosula]
MGFKTQHIKSWKRVKKQRALVAPVARFDAMMANQSSPESEYEDGKLVTRKIGLPPLDPSLGDFDISTFLTIEFWCKTDILSKHHHHPNVVAFYVVVQGGPGGTLATVTAYMVEWLMVGDFGLSKIKRDTLPWMAPELLNGSSNEVSEKVDVFSFGIVLWEILTGEEPYANKHYGAIIGGMVNNTLRPTIPSYCDSEWRRLME